MRILCLGDVVGDPGMNAIEKRLPGIVRDEKIDFCVVNGENAKKGSGLNRTIFDKLIKSGADAVTAGDHVFKSRDFQKVLETEHRMLRPANLTPGVPGCSSSVIAARNGVKVGVFIVLGRIFMKPMDCPFRVADREIQALGERADLIVVDAHMEATSEKIALGWHLDGRAAVIFGTHTHVATADERVLPRGTAYITDVGMTGAHLGVIGRKTEPVLKHLLSGVPYYFDLAEDDVRINGIIAEIDVARKRAVAIERFRLDVEK